MVKHIVRSLIGVAGLGLALALGGCDSDGLTIEGQRGVPFGRA